MIGGSALMLALPLIALLGNPVMWGLLPFAGIVLSALWFALRRNWQDRSILEEMQMDREGVHLRRVNPRGPAQEWHADPHWVAVNMIPNGGPVGNYLTLTGGGREVELGSFLTPEERLTLHAELIRLLRDVKSFS